MTERPEPVADDGRQTYTAVVVLFIW